MIRSSARVRSASMIQRVTLALCGSCRVMVTIRIRLRVRLRVRVGVVR